MGACDFSAYARGKTAAEAFRLAVQEAQYEHGHGGYTGTIAEKSEFKMVPAVMTLHQAHAFIAENMDNDTYNDKWGAAGCIEIVDPLSDPNPPDGKRGFLFFGSASS